MPHEIRLIAAIGSVNRELGKNNKLLWEIPQDLRHFKSLTMGHPVIMGRKTWESIPEKFRPLKGRTNVVVSNSYSSDQAPGANICASVAEAIEAAKTAEGSSSIFIIGGARLYQEALPLAEFLDLTLIDDEKEADVFFPEYESAFVPIHASEEFSEGDLEYRFVTFTRK